MNILLSSLLLLLISVWKKSSYQLFLIVILSNSSGTHYWNKDLISIYFCVPSFHFFTYSLRHVRPNYHLAFDLYTFLTNETHPGDIQVWVHLHELLLLSAVTSVSDLYQMFQHWNWVDKTIGAVTSVSIRGSEPANILCCHRHTHTYHTALCYDLWLNTAWKKTQMPVAKWCPLHTKWEHGHTTIFCLSSDPWWMIHGNVCFCWLFLFCFWGSWTTTVCLTVYVNLLYSSCLLAKINK